MGEGHALNLPFPTRSTADFQKIHFIGGAIHVQ